MNMDMKKQWFRYSSLAAVLLIVVGLIGTFMTGSQLVMRQSKEKVKNEEFFNDDIKSLIIDMKNANVSLIGSNREDVVVKTNVSKDLELNIELEDDKLLITTDDDFLSSFRICIFCFGTSEEVIVEFPKDMIDSIQVDTVNGLIDLDNIETNEIVIKTTNSVINVDNIIAKSSLSLKSTNGIIRLDNVYSNILHSKTTNGAITLENDKSPKEFSGEELYLKSTNGKISAENIYFEDVTVKTTNGSISLVNDDLEYVIKSLYYKTTNGSEYVNVNHAKRD